MLLCLALGGLIDVLCTGVAGQNRRNHIFNFYRATLMARFLPFARWLTHKRRLHDVEQSWNPYPIINAAANFGATLEPFELTPLHCGSPASGYYRTRDWLPELSLTDQEIADLHLLGTAMG